MAFYRRCLGLSWRWELHVLHFLLKFRIILISSVWGVMGIWHLGETRNACRILVVKRGEKIPLGRTPCMSV
jgi:hypothetical protein